MRVLNTFVQAHEMMDILDITREHVYRLIKRDPKFPEAWQLPKSPTRLWARWEVEEYAQQRNRKRGPRR